MVEKWAPWLSIIALGRPLPLRIYWIAMGIATYIQRSLLLPPASLNKLFSWAGQLASQLSRELLTWNSVVTPWAAACNEWKVIRGFLTRNKWIQYHVSPRASPTLYTDSSLTGWAWLLHEHRQGSVILGMRGGWHPGPHINVLELLTVRFAMQWLCTRCPGFTWHLACDNSTVVHQLRRGRTANFHVNRILSDLASLLQRTKSQILPEWVSTHVQRADEHTRLGLLPSALPEAFGSVVSSSSVEESSWLSALRPFLRDFSTPTSLDVPLGFLPTGL